MPLADSTVSGQLHVRHTCTGKEKQAECNTHDRNVVFPTASSPNSNTDIVCESIEAVNTRVLIIPGAHESNVRTLTAVEAEGTWSSDYNASFGAAIGTYR